MVVHTSSCVVGSVSAGGWGAYRCVHDLLVSSTPDHPLLPGGGSIRKPNLKSVPVSLFAGAGSPGCNLPAVL